MPQRDATKRFVLAVEDGDQDAAALEKAFERAGFRDHLRVVRDAEEATAYVLGASRFSDRARYPFPCLVLLDLHLPGRSGLHFMEWFRAQPESKGVPVVLMAGHVEYATVKGAFQAGATSYIVKPVEFDALVESVRTLLTYWLVMNTPA